MLFIVVSAFLKEGETGDVCHGPRSNTAVGLQPRSTTNRLELSWTTRNYHLGVQPLLSPSPTRAILSCLPKVPIVGLQRNLGKVGSCPADLLELDPLYASPRRVMASQWSGSELGAAVLHGVGLTI